MSENDEGLSIEELNEKAEEGTFSERGGVGDESIGGPMDVESLRLPEDIIRAYEIVGKKKRLGRTSIMRSALIEWLNEHYPEVLDEASGRETANQGISEGENKNEMELNIYEGNGVTVEAEQVLRSREADIHREIRSLRESLENGRGA